MKHKKIIVLIFSALVIFNVSIITAYGFEPYQNYTYSQSKQPIAEPQAVSFSTIIDGNSLGIGEFKEPNDIFIAIDDKIYVSDTKNNRIIVLNKDYSLNKIIDKIYFQGKNEEIDSPMGLFVTDDNIIYFAQPNQNRITVIDQNQNVVRFYGKPDTSLMAESIVYRPIKVTVDKELRIYTIIEGGTNGIVQLDVDGNFLGYFGPIKVTPSASDLFWRAIMTKEQKARTTTNVPTTYSSLDIDKSNFVFATVYATGQNKNPSTLIRKLNLMGNDILKRNSLFGSMGDLITPYDPISQLKEYSRFADISVSNYGIYSAVDVLRNRVFTYDSEGNLLFVFGNDSSQRGGFAQPSAIETINADTFLVVDSKYNQIVEFKLTEYGKAIINAVAKTYVRDYGQSNVFWEKILKYSSQSEMAYVGLGKSFYRDLNYKSAMENLLLANERSYYSKAFIGNRQLIIQNGFASFLIILIISAIAFIILRLIYKHRKGR